LSSLENLFKAGSPAPVAVSDQAPSESETEPETEIESGDVPESESEAPEAEQEPAEASTGVKEESVPPGTKTGAAKQDPLVPLGALQSERKRRQELERRIAEFEAKAQAQSTPEAEKPDFFADPEKYIESRVQTALKESQDRFLAYSEQRARERHSDFEEKLEAFSELVRSNPMYYQQMMQSPDPGEFAYAAGKNFHSVKGIGDIDTWRDQERARIRAEVEAEHRKQSALATAHSVPKSVAGVQGEGIKTQPEPVFNGPAPLSALFKKRR
jgi:hypothetical protein